MATRVAINGFGRIGRLVYRAFLESGRKDIDIVAINDLGDAAANAYLLKYDSVHGITNMDIYAEGEYLVAGDYKTKVIAQKDPKLLPWKEMDIDIVFECTGIFAAKEKAMVHIEAGAKRVLVSAPSEGADKTIVYGVNQDSLTKDDIVVSNASCTTNCLAPVCYVLDKEFGIKQGFMTTIHSYTNDQKILDQLHKDLYRARAAAMSMIPTKTGAAKAIGLVLPQLAGKLDGVSVRVPTPDVSLVDANFIMEREVTKEEVNAALKKYAEGELKGVLGYNELPLVSIDFTHNPASSTFDANGTKVMGGTQLRVMSWYDNEWGFSNRMLDTAAAMAKLI
ncbi:MAG: type I glyceraldehyde-3-phosphate dehydrogenase [Alphaproteobacteria bacterium]|nr:type I glyceraldehyde-3-phosphate dehydrogenase [Alphaproteobacteria bacterium]